jgi:hypothetical protein
MAVLSVTTASAQQRRTVIFGDAGLATLGYADSQQGTAPIVGGGAGFHLTPYLVVEGEVHAGRVNHVFGRENHAFSEVTATGSVLFRAAVGNAAFVAGGGLALQRAHTELNEPSFPAIDRAETLRLFHGRIGADWDVSDRVVIRTQAVLWMGAGLDWVVGGRVGVGYRF